MMKHRLIASLRRSECPFKHRHTHLDCVFCCVWQHKTDLSPFSMSGKQLNALITWTVHTILCVIHCALVSSTEAPMSSKQRRRFGQLRLLGQLYNMGSELGLHNAELVERCCWVEAVVIESRYHLPLTESPQVAPFRRRGAGRVHSGRLLERDFACLDLAHDFVGVRTVADENVLGSCLSCGEKVEQAHRDGGGVSCQSRPLQSHRGEKEPSRWTDGESEQREERAPHGSRGGR